jgi:hypothetical protein
VADSTPIDVQGSRLNLSIWRRFCILPRDSEVLVPHLAGRSLTMKSYP